MKELRVFRSFANELKRSLHVIRQSAEAMKKGEE